MISKVRITASGWETFTGQMASVEFENGVSVDPVSRILIDRLSALVTVEHTDDDGVSTGEQAGEAARMVMSRDVPTEVIPAMKHPSAEEMAQEKRDDMAKQQRLPVDRYYTMTELEAIASKEGINGLRKISDPWKVKDRAIGKLIVLILEAQDEHRTKVGEINEGNRKAAAAALAESLAKQAAKEAHIDATARVLTGEKPISSDDSEKLVLSDDSEKIYLRTAAEIEAERLAAKQPVNQEA